MFLTFIFFILIFPAAIFLTALYYMTKEDAGRSHFSSKSCLTYGFNQISSVCLSPEAVGMKVIKIVLRQVGHKGQTVHNLNTRVASCDLFYLVTEIIEFGKPLLIITSPDGRDAQNRDLLSIDIRQDSVILLNRFHGLASVLIGAKGNDDLIGSIPFHFHQGFAVVYISAYSLVDDIVVQKPVGNRYISLCRPQGSVSLGNGISQPENPVSLNCLSDRRVSFKILHKNSSIRRKVDDHILFT